MRILRVAMAQMNPLVGDIAANMRLIASIISDAKSAGADLVAFPELAITGYPPEDLLLKPRFIADNQEALAELACECMGIVAVVGHVGQGSTVKRDNVRPSVVIGDRHELYNAASILADGRCMATYCKRLLPNYGVFDEAR
ncbi:MAG: NAD+ synthase, partial [Gemmatimonadota bacterium]|nr:NAD+ synthase [Gemmatimonadota bacterium]